MALWEEPPTMSGMPYDNGDDDEDDDDDLSI